MHILFTERNEIFNVDATIRFAEMVFALIVLTENVAADIDLVLILLTNASEAESTFVLIELIDAFPEEIVTNDTLLMLAV